MNKQARSFLILLVLLIVVVAGGYFALNRGSLGGIVKDSGENVSEYSAVFLTNGQVYFGKIHGIGDSVDLRDIYYLQVNQTDLQAGSSPRPSASPSTSPDISLVKLGNELHGPNDRMLINRDQVLFTESLKKDSKVVSAINDYAK